MEEEEKRKLIHETVPISSGEGPTKARGEGTRGKKKRRRETTKGNDRRRGIS
jgi:hypothetical protein